MLSTTPRAVAFPQHIAQHAALNVVQKTAQKVLLLAVFTVVALGMPLAANAAEPISKALLMRLARENTGVLCQSEVFTQCMGFTAARCDEIKEEAISTCFGPLPDSIDPETLQNSTLEDCPHQVYKDAGFPEEKAKMCFNEAMDALAASDTQKPADDK